MYRRAWFTRPLTKNFFLYSCSGSGSEVPGPQGAAIRSQRQSERLRRPTSRQAGSVHGVICPSSSHALTRTDIFWRDLRGWACGQGTKVDNDEVYFVDDRIV